MSVGIKPYTSLCCDVVKLQFSQPGKLADTALPTIQNSVSVADFGWDPFDPHKLVVGMFPFMICICILN